MKTTSLLTGSIYHGGIIVERMDSRRKNYRQVYRCVSDDRDCVLVRFILNDIPSSLIQLKEFRLPAEYVFVDCYNSMYPIAVLPDILNCDFDADEAWYIREYIEGRSLREEVEYCHQVNLEEGSDKLLEAFICWLIISGYMYYKCLPSNMKYNLTPDNLFVSRKADGSPSLVMFDIESALAIQSEIRATDSVNIDTRFLPPEIFCDIYNEKSYVYVFAMLVVFSLRGSLQEDRPETGGKYEPLIAILKYKDKILEGINISPDEKILLLEALSSNPDNRPTYEEFTREWPNYNESSNPSDFIETSNRDRTTSEGGLNLGTANKFDNMFRMGSGGGFKDIAGMDGLKKKLLHMLIYPIKYPDIAEIYGVKMPNGIMMYGPPGCGKSFLAEKTCEEINCMFIKIKASDLGGQWHREGISNIGDLFNAAERKSRAHGGVPICIIIDEADGIIQVRNQEMSPGAASETNQFLTELESCQERGIFVIATSNDPRQIDPAALRTGRLGDLVINIPLPDDDTKNAILKLGLSKLPCADINTEQLIHLTKNFSSSDVASIAKLSALRAMTEMIDNIECGVSKKVVTVTEDIVRMTIEEITPSLSECELHRQELIHDSFSVRNRNHRSKIGFR